MTAPLYAIGRFCARYHWPTIVVWIVALVLAGQAGESKTNDNLTLPGTGSTEAGELLEGNLPDRAFASNLPAFQARAGIEGEDFFAKHEAALADAKRSD